METKSSSGFLSTNISFDLPWSKAWLLWNQLIQTMARWAVLCRVLVWWCGCLNCIHAERKTGAEQRNAVCLGKEESPRKKFQLLCFILFFVTAAPRVNILLAAKLRTDVVNFGTCLTCLFDGLYLSFSVSGSSGIFPVSAGGALHWCLYRTERCCTLVLDLL